MTKLVDSGVVLAIPLVKYHSSSHRRNICSGVKGVASATCVIGEEPGEKFTKTLPVSGDPWRRGVGQVGDQAVGIEDLGHLLLQGGEDGGKDARLEVVEHHQGERVAGQGLESRLIDTMLLCPSLYSQNQWSHPVVCLRITKQEVSVPNAGWVVHTEINLKAPGSVEEFQYWDLCIDKLNPALDEMAAVPLKQSSYS